MATFTNTIKNSSSVINTSKNNISFVNNQKAHAIRYILTDAYDYVLLGQNEDMILVWDCITEFTNINKN